MFTVVALAVAFAALSGVASSSGAPAKAAINLNGVVSQEQCAPCHYRLGEATYPGLTFSHGNHLMVNCTACHYRMAHVGGTTYRPPMESCFNCHGLSHGPQGELATSKCRDCHTSSFNLKPKTHTANWKQKPHALASAKTANSCLMCHDSKNFCDKCHIKEGVEYRMRQSRYIPVLPVTKEGAAVNVYPQRGTTISQCVNCHPDLDNFSTSKTGVIFAHDPHIRRNFQCSVCHKKFGHADASIDRPSMRSCYRCHGLTHSANGIVAAEDCRKCHPKDFTLKPKDHTDAFIKGGHKTHATKDVSYCAMCHKSDFCVQCHQGRKAQPSGAKGKKVIPADHRKADWTGKHGKLFLAQKGECGSCHDEPTCMTCHQTPMPHPVNWLKQHGAAARQSAVYKTDKFGARVKTNDCNVCHTDRSTCQDCHHAKVKRAPLVASRCVGCHPEMKQTPATSIKNKGFAEHAVHFNVAKKKGEPYLCEDCHVSFKTNDAASLQQGHDLKLCYECHGNIDFEHVLIAPYPGAELCRRCHQDLHI